MRRRIMSLGQTRCNGFATTTSYLNRSSKCHVCSSSFYLSIFLVDQNHTHRWKRLSSEIFLDKMPWISIFLCRIEEKRFKGFMFKGSGLTGRSGTPKVLFMKYSNRQAYFWRWWRITGGKECAGRSEAGWIYLHKEIIKNRGHLEPAVFLFI